ncbi:uncharacterized protein LOC106092490 [Stomoxys calcitrans]|uniref:uncharacterized protein LOC106092490 n=1 Tax=Stomoxys calcitrans TaxID=35570 RepID=UPI0027E37B6D|nr:uncharacterized protein LOC106092490 [Stomoxys calcitrans]
MWNKLLIWMALLALINIEITLGLPQALEGSANDVFNAESVKETKRFTLAKFAYENLRRSLWPKEIYPKMAEYISGLQEWCERDESWLIFPKYPQLQESLDNCRILLKGLMANPENCPKQLALQSNHDNIRSIFQDIEEENVKNEWTSRYMAFVLDIRPILVKSAQEFYEQLADKVKSYIANLKEEEAAEGADILAWNEKFTSDIDNVRKEVSVIEFMGLFPDERSVLENKCKVQYKNVL